MSFKTTKPQLNNNNTKLNPNPQGHVLASSGWIKLKNKDDIRYDEKIKEILDLMVKHDVYLSISLQDKHGTNDVANYTQMTSCILYPNNPNFDYKQKTFDTPITLPTENKVEIQDDDIDKIFSSSDVIKEEDDIDDQVPF